MKLKIDPQQLDPFLSRLSHMEGSKDIWLIANKDQLTLTADNIKARWTFSFPAQIEAPGDAYVPANKFLSYLKSSKQPIITLETTKADLVLECDSFSAKIPLVDGALFPSTREHKPDAKESLFHAASFHAAVAAVSCVTDDVKGFSYTTGIQIRTDAAKGIAIATDRKQVMVKYFEVEGEIPTSTANAHHLLQASVAEVEKIKVIAQDNLIHMEATDRQCDFLLYQEQMPDVLNLFTPMRERATIEATMQSESFLEALSFASRISSTKDSFWYCLDMLPSGARLRCNDDRVDEAVFHVNGSCSEQMSIWINVPKLSASLNHLNKLGLFKSQINLKLISPREPFFIPLSDGPSDFLVTTPVIPPYQQKL